MPGAFNTLTGQLLANIPGTTFVSGYSVAMALAMVACGSSEGGALESELLALFGKGSLSALQAYVVKAQASLHAGRGEGLELLQANSLWARGGLKEGFSKAFTEVFHGGFVAPLTTRDPINQFVSTATKGLVNELIPFDPTPDTLAILVNTAYFRGMWAAQFSKDMTQKSRFCGARGEASVQMMSRKFVVRDGVGYAPGVPIGKAKADVLSMPYQGGRFHGVFALPSSAADIDLLVAAMADGDAWPSLHKPTQPTEVRVFVPRFKLDSGLLSLADLLKTNGGVPSLSTPENLLRVSDSPDLAVSDVLHRAVVEVNEEGTEAAAATAVILRKGCARRPPAPIPEFRCDRPFLFAVYDTQMRFPLFAGAVHDLPPA